MNRNKVKEINQVFLMTVLFSVIASFINGIILAVTNNYLIILLTSQIILILPTIIYLTKNKIKLSKAIRLKKIKASNSALVVLFAFLIIPVMTFINAISMLFVENTTSTLMINVIENNGLLASLFMIALVPAVFEEIVYRGMFYNEYSKENPLQAIFLSAFLFGIIHLNLNQFAYAFAVGIIFALIIEATDSILSTMIIHFIINGNSVFGLYIYPKLIEGMNKFIGMQIGGEDFNVEQYFSEIIENVDQILSFSYIMETYFVTALICFVLAFIVYRTIAKNNGRWEYIKDIFKGNQKNGKLISGSLVAGIVICIVIMIMQEISFNL